MKVESEKKEGRSKPLERELKRLKSEPGDIAYKYNDGNLV